MNPIVLNYAQCIKQEAHWGYDKWHNICTGTWNTVSWGSMDWTHQIFGGAIFTMIVALPLLFVGVMIAADRAQAKAMERFAF